MAEFRNARVLFASTLIVLASQGLARAAEERLGEVNLPISCSPAAQQQFNRGLAMQHSFFFPETVKAFTAIAEQEPSCAMAYWGIAISQRPNPLVGPFPGDVLKRGWEAIEKARAASQKTEREIAWIEALAAYYQDYATVPQQKRTANYEAAMARLSARYPDDAEAAIFSKDWRRSIQTIPASRITSSTATTIPSSPCVGCSPLRVARDWRLRRRTHYTCPRTSTPRSACGRRRSVRIARPTTRPSPTRCASIRRPPPTLRKTLAATISSTSCPTPTCSWARTSRRNASSMRATASPNIRQPSVTAGTRPLQPSPSATPSSAPPGWKPRRWPFRKRHSRKPRRLPGSAARSVLPAAAI